MSAMPRVGRSLRAFCSESRSEKQRRSHAQRRIGANVCHVAAAAAASARRALCARRPLRRTQTWLAVARAFVSGSDLGGSYRRSRRSPCLNSPPGSQSTVAQALRAFAVGGSRRTRLLSLPVDTSAGVASPRFVLAARPNQHNMSAKPLRQFKHGSPSLRAPRGATNCTRGDQLRGPLRVANRV